MNSASVRNAGPGGSGCGCRVMLSVARQPVSASSAMQLHRTVVTYGTTCAEREVKVLLGVVTSAVVGHLPSAPGSRHASVHRCLGPGGAAQPLASADPGVLIRGAG